MLWGSRPPARGLRQALPHCRGARGEEWLPLHTCDVRRGLLGADRLPGRKGSREGPALPVTVPAAPSALRGVPALPVPEATKDHPRAPPMLVRPRSCCPSGCPLTKPPRIPGGVTSLAVLWLPLRLVPPVTSHHPGDTSWHVVDAQPYLGPSCGVGSGSELQGQPRCLQHQTRPSQGGPRTAMPLAWPFELGHYLPLGPIKPTGPQRSQYPEPGRDGPRGAAGVAQ